MILVALAGLYLVDLIPLLLTLPVDLFYGILIFFPNEYAEAILGDPFNLSSIVAMPAINGLWLWWSGTQTGTEAEEPTNKDEAGGYLIEEFWGGQHGAYKVSNWGQIGISLSYLISRILLLVGV